MPVRACVAYMVKRGSSPSPFFRGMPLTKRAFVRKVKGLVTRAGLDANLYSGHSFRIGAATSAARAGIQD